MYGEYSVYNHQPTVNPGNNICFDSSFVLFDPYYGQQMVRYSCFIYSHVLRSNKIGLQSSVHEYMAIASYHSDYISIPLVNRHSGLVQCDPNPRQCDVRGSQWLPVRWKFWTERLRVALHRLGSHWTTGVGAIRGCHHWNHSRPLGYCLLHPVFLDVHFDRKCHC